MKYSCKVVELGNIKGRKEARSLQKMSKKERKHKSKT
jgi:hypothetical protein